MTSLFDELAETLRPVFVENTPEKTKEVNQLVKDGFITVETLVDEVHISTSSKIVYKTLKLVPTPKLFSEVVDVDEGVLY